MDYPELNFLVGLGLIFAESLSIGLLVILSRAALPPNTWRAALGFAVLSVLSFTYIAILLIQSMTPVFFLRFALVALILGAAVAGLTSLVYRRHLSVTAYRLIGVGFILSTLASFLLSYLLFRSLVALPG